MSFQLADVSGMSKKFIKSLFNSNLEGVVIVCDGSSKKQVTCPKDHRINVEKAFYGRDDKKTLVK